MLMFNISICSPDAPCMEYLPTFKRKYPINDANVGKYTTHGAAGFYSMVKHPYISSISIGFPYIPSISIGFP